MLVGKLNDTLSELKSWQSKYDQLDRKFGDLQRQLESVTKERDQYLIQINQYKLELDDWRNKFGDIERRFKDLSIQFGNLTRERDQYLV